jgi:hypothetical protein
MTRASVQQGLAPPLHLIAVTTFRLYGARETEFYSCIMTPHYDTAGETEFHSCIMTPHHDTVRGTASETESHSCIINRYLMLGREMKLGAHMKSSQHQHA